MIKHKANFPLPLTPSLTEALSKMPLVVGIAPNAWPRLVPSWFLPKYQILAYRDRQESDYAADVGVKIFSLQKKYPEIVATPLTARGILDAPQSQEFLSGLKEPFALLVYKSSKKLEELVDEKGWQLLANRSSVKDMYEDKRIFKEIIKNIGLEAIPGENLPVDDLNEKKFQDLQEKYGRKLVLQLAEVTYGGGSGTLFLDNVDQLSIFRERVTGFREKLVGKEKKITTVNIAPYLKGISASIACCATKHGVLTGPIQTQIIDILEVGAKKPNRSGNFAGHDWNFCRVSAAVYKEARKVAATFGQYLYQQGYRGIFGLDLIIEEGTNKIWPVECNPRYTDAFPTVSFLMMEKGLLPLDVFHLLELVGVKYDFDVNAWQEKMAGIELNGSQILLHTHTDLDTTNRGIVQAGIYQLKNHTLEFLRPGLTPLDLENEEEFLITEGVAKRSGEKYCGMGRICRMVTKTGILASQDQLTGRVKEAIRLLYDRFNLQILPNAQ